MATLRQGQVAASRLATTLLFPLAALAFATSTSWAADGGVRSGSSDAGPEPARISIDMSEVAVEPGGTFTFTARVSGTSPGQPAPVSWSVEEGPKGGTIDAGGKYTAPSTEGTYHVSASRSGASARASAAVTVRALKALGPDRRTVWRLSLI